MPEAVAGVGPEDVAAGDERVRAVVEVAAVGHEHLVLRGAEADAGVRWRARSAGPDSIDDRRARPGRVVGAAAVGRPEAEPQVERPEDLGLVADARPTPERRPVDLDSHAERPGARRARHRRRGGPRPPGAIGAVGSIVPGGCVAVAPRGGRAASSSPVARVAGVGRLGWAASSPPVRRRRRGSAGRRPRSGGRRSPAPRQRSARRTTAPAATGCRCPRQRSWPSCRRR